MGSARASSRWHVWLICVALVVSLIAWVISLSCGEALAPLRSEFTPDQVEQWVSATNSAGSGIVKRPAANGSPDRELAVQVRRLSVEGSAMLGAHIDRNLRRMEHGIEESLGGSTGSESSEDYLAQLRLMDDYEEMRAIDDLFRRGLYLVMANGQDAPPTPPGARSVRISPFPLEDGQFGYACFLFNIAKRKELADVVQAIQEVSGAMRSDRMQAFNALPAEDRHKKADWYCRLQERLKLDQIKAVEPSELREFLIFRAGLERLGINMDCADAIMIAR